MYVFYNLEVEGFSSTSMPEIIIGKKYIDLPQQN